MVPALAATLLSAAAACAIPAPARAGVSAGDRRATRIYIDAGYQLVRAARANLPASEAAIHGLVRRTIGECPLAGEGAYVNRAANEVSEEVLGTLVTAAEGPDAASVERFVRTAAVLRWSNHKLTRLVHGYLQKLRNLLALAPANTCADVRTWAAAGFRSAPAGTVQFDKLYAAADVEAEPVPLRLLAPYESARDAAQLRRIKRIEAPVAEAEAKAVENWQEIMKGLALSV
jgi:hypothetical protein